VFGAFFTATSMIGFIAGGDHRPQLDHPRGLTELRLRQGNVLEEEWWRRGVAFPAILLTGARSWWARS